MVRIGLGRQIPIYFWKHMSNYELLAESLVTYEWLIILTCHRSPRELVEEMLSGQLDWHRFAWSWS